MSEEVKHPEPATAKSKTLCTTSGLVYTTCGYGYVELPMRGETTSQPLTEEEKAQLPEMNQVKLASGASLALHVPIPATPPRRRKVSYRRRL